MPELDPVNLAACNAAALRQARALAAVLGCDTHTDSREDVTVKFQLHMTEKQLQAQVVRAARLLGWQTYHTYDSRRSDKGFPDLVLCNGRRVIYAELKSDTGRLRREQRTWLELLRSAGCEVHVWRPRDWADIVKVLGG